MKNIKDDIFENIKNPKIIPKGQKPKKSQNLKSHVRRPQMKNFRKEYIVRIVKY